MLEVFVVASARFTFKHTQANTQSHTHTHVVKHRHTHSSRHALILTHTHTERQSGKHAHKHKHTVRQDTGKKIEYSVCSCYVCLLFAGSLQDFTAPRTSQD